MAVSFEDVLIAVHRSLLGVLNDGKKSGQLNSVYSTRHPWIPLISAIADVTLIPLQLVLQFFVAGWCYCGSAQRLEKSASESPESPYKQQNWKMFDDSGWPPTRLMTQTSRR